ncbi:MAG: glycosyltransferase [Actinomycetota bacterium]
MQRKPKIVAIVPTFGPDIDLVGRLEHISLHVDSVIVVDDGSGPSAVPVLDALVAAGLEVIRSQTNRGIAAALNTGTALALKRGADFVLTIDQDSELVDDYIEACVSAFATSSTAGRIGVVCADVINDAPSIPEDYTDAGLGIVREAIQSGFVISRECLEECGLFDARLFIDAVDTEFCLRISAYGFLTVIVPGTRIIHSLGEQAPFRPFGRQRVRDGIAVTYEYHRPFRRYFIVRNNIDLYFRYFRTRPAWVRSSIRREINPTVKSIVSGPYRGRELLSLIAGTAHGVIRRRGPLSPALRRLLVPSS